MRANDAKQRKNILKNELNRIIKKLPYFGVKKAILFGSLANGKIAKTSDIDLILIKDTDKRFLDRLDEFYQNLGHSVGMDILVYTPEEIKKLKKTNLFIKKALKEGRVIYEAKTK